MENKGCGVSEEQNFVSKEIDSEAENQGPEAYLPFYITWDGKGGKRRV